jgi:hypothetical protein
MRRLYGSLKLGLALGTFAIVLGIAVAAWQNPFAPPAVSAEGGKVTPVFADDLPHLWSGPLGPDSGQAAGLTVDRACCSSKVMGLRYPRAECSRWRL